MLEANRSEIPNVQLLTRLTELASVQGDQAALLESIAVLVRDIGSVARCALYLVVSGGVEGTESVTLAASAGSTHASSYAAERAERRLAAQVTRTKQGKTVARGEIPGVEEAMLCVPMVAEGVPHGAVVAEGREGGGDFTDEEYEVILAAAGLTAAIIARTQLQQHANHLARELSKAFDHMPSGIVVFGPGGDVRRRNRRAKALLSWKRLEAVQLEEALRPDQADIFRNLLDDVIRAGSDVTVNIEYLNKPLRIQGIPIEASMPDTKAHPTLEDILVLIEDMSLSREVSELRRLDEMKDNFIAIVSHEMRTPLTAIRGAAELLSSHCGDELSQDTHDLLRILSGNTDRLVGVVNSIIDISLLDQDSLELQPETGDLREIASAAAESLVASLGPKSLRIEKRAEGDSFPVVVDHGRMRQVILSLLDNAIKYSPENGVITMEFRCEGSVVSLALSDQGAGIPTEHEQTVFEKFRQIEGPMTRHYGGNGLGLYLAREIAFLHEGNLTVEQVDEGACLKLTLPRA